MKKRKIINNVPITIDDGNPTTQDIVDISDCPELCMKAEKQRLGFLIHSLNSMGYRAIDRNGNEVNIGDYNK